MGQTDGRIVVSLNAPLYGGGIITARESNCHRRGRVISSRRPGAITCLNSFLTSAVYIRIQRMVGLTLAADRQHLEAFHRHSMRSCLCPPEQTNVIAVIRC